VQGHREHFVQGALIDAIIIDFSKGFDLVLNDGLFMNPVSLCVDLRVVLWVREFIQ
jgi:hypothetical protein